MAKSKKCVIKGYGRWDNSRYHVNEETKDIDDIWYTCVPDGCTDEKITPIKVFESKAAAKPYLQRIKSEGKESSPSIYNRTIVWLITEHNE